jgi:hypothetical protein
MIPIVGVFRTRADAERCYAELISTEMGKSRIHLLTADVSKEELASVPVMEGEEPGMGKTMGAVVGGAMGLAGGFEVAEVLLALLPGIGAVVAIGLSSAALLTALGAVGGGTIGGALENSVFKGLPEEEFFVYKDALRQGRNILIVTPNSRQEENLVKEKLLAAGAESIDPARKEKWLGLHDEEKEKYQSGGEKS